MARKPKAKAKKQRKRPAHPKAVTDDNPTPLGNQRNLADALGVSQPAIRKWLQHPDWPFPRVAPWKIADLPAMELWRKENLRQDHADRPPASGDEKAARVDVLRERARKLKLQNDETDGRLHDSKACEAATVKRIHVLKGALTALSASLPEQIHGLDKSQMGRQIRKVVNDMLTAFSRGEFEEWAKKAKAAS